MFEVAKQSAINLSSKALSYLLKKKAIRVNRKAFLYRNLSKYYPEDKVRQAIMTTPQEAGIEPKILERIALYTIKIHVLKATVISFSTNVPPPPYSLALIVPDIADFYLHLIWISQKLAYLYGWPEIASEDDIDEEAQYRILLFMATLMGIDFAERGIKELSKRLGFELSKRIPNMVFGKEPAYVLTKRLLKWISIRLSKPLVAKIVGKNFWVVGGTVNASLTYVSINTMAKKYQKFLRELPCASPRKTE